MRREVFGWSRDPWVLPHECFEVTAAESSTLYQILDANGSIYHGYYVGEGADSGWFAGFDKAATEQHPQGPYLIADVIYPHGQYVIFGG